MMALLYNTSAKGDHAGAATVLRALASALRFGHARAMILLSGLLIAASAPVAAGPKGMSRSAVYRQAGVLATVGRKLFLDPALSASAPTPASPLSVRRRRSDRRCGDHRARHRGAAS